MADNSFSAYNKAEAIRRTGFIAQEVEKAATDVHYDFSGVVKPETPSEHYGLSYEAFVAPLVKAVQQQQQIIADQQKQINRLTADVEALQKDHVHH